MVGRPTAYNKNLARPPPDPRAARPPPAGAPRRRPPPVPRPHTRDIAELTYKTLNTLPRLSTYLQEFQPTYKTFRVPTRPKYDRQLDLKPIYKTLNQFTRH